MPEPSRSSSLSRWPLAAFMAYAGYMHFKIADEFLGQVPPFIPLREEVVAVTGVMELGLGLGLAFAPARHRPLVGKLLAAFLVAVFPGNIYQAVANVDAFGLNTSAARWGRLIFQPPLIAWALWSSSAWQPGENRS